MSLAKTWFSGSALVVFLLLACSPSLAYSQAAVDSYNHGVNLTSGGNYTLAVAAFENATAIEPGYFEAWNGIADVLNRNGQFEEALAASNRSLSINPDYVDGWINRGQILYNIGYKYEDAAHDTDKANQLYAEQLDAFDRAIAIDPQNADAWFNRAYALAGLKRYDEAIADFDKVQALDPSYPNLAANRKIAVQLRDASVPVYADYSIPVAAALAAIVGAVVWFTLKRKKSG
ncbi:MAG TPA: tetratricopeptide repeat protein [Methanoregula sp.]|nr:tetratricopeptide repeat protein [Methanoregula sp.]